MSAAISPPLDRRDWIAGLEKGLGILVAFDIEHSRLTASQVGQRCGLTRTAARRYLLTLAHLGYVATDGKLFWLSPRIMRLGQAYLESARLPRTVQPYLQRVTAGTGETAYVGVLDGYDIVYVARSGSHRHMHNGYLLGSRVQAHSTAAGMMMLSLSPPTRWRPGCRPSRCEPIPLTPSPTGSSYASGLRRRVVRAGVSQNNSLS